MATLEQIRRYLQKKQEMINAIEKTIQDPEVIYGQKAVNIQMNKPYLKVPTYDYDVYSNNPRQSARQTEQAIDRLMRFDASRIQKAKNKDTIKVKSNVSGETLADYTKMRKKVPYKKINGKRYMKLSAIQKHTKQTLKNKSATHRVHKDKLISARIQLNKKPKRKFMKGATKLKW